MKTEETEGVKVSERQGGEGDRKGWGGGVKAVSLVAS